MLEQVTLTKMTTCQFDYSFALKLICEKLNKHEMEFEIYFLKRSKHYPRIKIEGLQTLKFIDNA